MTTKKKWSAKVDTDSTHPDEGLFKKSPTAIAKALASKKVSPKGAGSGMRMLNFYINRAGKNLPEGRRQALEKAKSILSNIIAEQKQSSAPTKNSAAKKTATKQAATKRSSTKKAAAKKITRTASKKSSRTIQPMKRAAKKAA